jgi:hypothetical protein
VIDKYGEMLSVPISSCDRSYFAESLNLHKFLAYEIDSYSEIVE